MSRATTAPAASSPRRGPSSIARSSVRSYAGGGTSRRGAVEAATGGTTLVRSAASARSVGTVATSDRLAAARLSRARVAGMSRRSAGSLAIRPATASASGPPRRQRRHRVGDDRGEDAERVVGVEGRAALGRGEQRGAEGPQVALGTEGPAAGALGRHVRGRAQDDAGGGERRVAGGGGDAEVGEHGATVRGDEDVARLHVAVHHALCVRGLQRSEDAETDLGHPVRRQRAGVPHQLGQAAGRQQLHDDPGPVVLLHDVVGPHDVGVAEPGGRPRLPHRPFAQVGDLRGAELRGEPHLLHGHLPVQDVVVRLPHGAHAALPDRTDEAVAAAEGALVVGRAHPRLPTPCGPRNAPDRSGVARRRSAS